MKKYFSILVFILLFSSCATLMNKRKTHVAIIANTPVKVVIDKDTLISKRNKVVVLVPRQKEPFHIKVLNDSVSRNFTIHSANSLAYWWNIFGNFGLGQLVDKASAKRYAYPKRIRVIMSSLDKDSMVYLPGDSRMSIYNNNVKITPFRLLFIHPGFEFGYERYIGKRFSAQVSAAQLYNITYYVPSGSGYQFSLEGKYFDIRRLKKIVAYTSLEVGYFNIDIDGLWIESERTSKTTYVIIAAYKGHQTFLYALPKIGMQGSMGKLILFDLYVGLGFKHEQGHYTNSYSPYDTKDEDFWELKPAFNGRIGLRF